MIIMFLLKLYKFIYKISIDGTDKIAEISIRPIEFRPNIKYKININFYPLFNLQTYNNPNDIPNLK